MTISFSGLASGLDTSSWVESLVKLKQAKIDTLQEEKEGIELTKDTLESIKSFFSSFRSMLEKVTDSKFGIAATDLFAQNLATSANLDVLTATATTEAEESTYNVLVDQLATNSAAKSNYSYMTTIIQTTTATADSKLINLGVKTGNIGVKVNGIERGIEITDSDTISSFIEKLQNIGVNASFNDKTGIFSMDISANDINDIDKTGIVNAFKLSGVNEGYTSNSLKITSTDTIYSAATNDTKLSELGAKAGTLIIKANDTEYKITIDENTTLGEFIKKLNDNKINANLDKTGILTIVDANITNEGTTNIKNALGLELDIYSNTQKSNDLSHKTVITQTTTATSDTLLKDLGGEIKDNQTVIVKNSNNEYTTITVGTSTTLGDLLTKISNAGLYAAIDTEGRVEISGGTITGGTFNAIKALGLTSEPYSAITTGKPLTETVRKAELVTLETKLVDEMKVRAGYIEVTDNDGNKFYEKIYHGQTIADFMSDMGNLGIYTKLRDDGVLEITGGAFATLSDDKVKELIANGTIRETDDRYKQGTDLLTCLYGSSVISTDQITVASTYSKSRALTKKVVNTIAASLTSTLENLSLQADGTAIFDVRGDNRTIEVAKTDTLQNLMDKLKDVGIASSWNSNTQQFTIENATLEGGTANLGSVLNLTKTISGKYVTSNSLNKLETVTIDATRTTTLNKYGISNSMSDADRTVKLFDNNAKLVGSLTVTEATTIGDVLDFVNKNSGMNASIVDGILQIEGGYIENAALEKSMGLTTENKSSFALGSIMTVTTVAAVTGSTTLGQIISTLGTADAVKDGYSLTFNSKSLSVSATTTLDQLISQIFTNGGSASLDNTGRLSISGGVVAGSVATALGITTVSTTTAVSATGKTLVTTKTEYADLETKLSDVGVSDNSTIILNDKEGSAYKTITVNGSTTVKDVFASLKAEGIDSTISNGVISLKSAEYKYITGTVATALGIGTQTVTDVVNTSVYSTSKVTFTGSGLADGTTAIGSIVGVTADNNKLTIKDKNNNTIGTVTVTDTTTLDELFGMLAKFNITGKVRDGVISFDSPSGNYVQGGLVDSWSMTATTIIVTTTVGKTSTSTVAISHTVTKTADINTTLAQLGVDKGNTLIVHKTDGGTSTVTVSGSTTLDSLFDTLDNHGVQGVVAEGIITFTSVDGAYLTDASGSDLLSKLGVTTATKTVTTTTTKGATMTSGTLTYTGTESATLANKVLSYTTLTTNQTVTVMDSSGNTKGSVTVTADTTFSDLFKALDDLGIQGTMEDGMVTLTSNNGSWVTGLEYIGITAITQTTTVTTTVGTSTSGSALSYTLIQDATGSTTFKQIGASGNQTWTILDGQTNAIIAHGSFGENTTIGEFLDKLGQYGFSASIDGGFVTVSSPRGLYVTGGAANTIGLQTYSYTMTVNGTTTNIISATDTITIDQTRTITTSGFVTVNASDTITVDITTTSTVKTSGYVTIEAKETITVDVTRTITTSTSGSVTIKATDTITVDITKTIATDSTGSVTIKATDTITVSVTKTIKTDSSSTITINTTQTITVNMTETQTVSSTGTTTVSVTDTITVNITQTISTDSSGSTIITNTTVMTMTVAQTLTTTVTVTSAVTTTQASNTCLTLDDTIYSGWAGNYVIKGNRTSIRSTITILGTMTVGSMIDALNKNTMGVSFSFEDGRVIVSASYENDYHWGLTSESAFKLGIYGTIKDGMDIYAGVGSKRTTTKTVTVTQTTTSTINTTSTVSVQVTKTITDSFTVALDTTGNATLNITKTYTVSDTQTVTVKSTGTTTVNIQQTLSIGKTQTVTVATTGTETITIQQTMTVSATSTENVSTTGFVTVTIRQTMTINATSTEQVSTTGSATVNVKQTLTISATSTENVETTGTVTVTTKQTLTISATSTEQVNTTGTVNISQTVTVTASDTITIDVTSTRTVTANKSSGDHNQFSTVNNLNGNTKLYELGFGTGTVSGVNNGQEFTVSINGSTTIDGFAAQLAAHGIEVIVNVGGSLTFKGSNTAYVTSASGFAEMLGAGSAYTTTTSTVESGYNSLSNQLSHNVTITVSSSSTMGDINKTGTITVNYLGNTYTVTASASKTIGDVLTELAGYGISSSIENGIIKLVGTKDGYITNFGGAFGLTGSAYTTTTTSKVSGVNSNSNKQVYSSTVSINPTSTFSQLGMSANGTMVINNNGTLYTVTAKTTDTLDSLLTTIAGLGIAGSIADGKLTLAGTADGFISSMSDNLKTALKLNVGSGNSYSTSTKTICSQGTSGNLGYVSTNAALTSSTKLSNINGFTNGNGKLVIHQTNGQFVTISIDATKTLGEFFTDISRYGLVGNINDGKVSIEGIGNVYMQATDGGSNILTALKLSNVIQNVQTVTVNRTSNILSHTVTVAASGTTQLGNLADSLGNTIGSGNGTIVLSTTSNAGNQNVTLTFDRTKSIYDVIDALAGYGINASLDALGKFSINSSTLTDFSISGNLGTLLMGTYTKVYGKGETFNISTNLVEKTTLPMSKTDLLSSFGITNGNILITQQGVNYTVNINTTQVKTVADFMKLLSSYGFESDIDSAGRLYVSGVGKSYLSSISGGSNILDKFGLTNWSLGDVKQESKHLGDYKVNNITCSLDTKLNQLTDASGSNLGISSGNIYVYQDGTRYLVNIDNNDTLQTLSAKLAQYGITMGLSTEGKLYFDGTNDSYMTTDGITNGASNILNRLNIAGNWSTRYDSTSENLSYTTKSNNIVSGSTKLADLQDSDGKNLGITTGAFYVYNSGSRSTESITADMTVNDLMATLAKHGLVADIAEDGSISIGAYNNTYLATSALTTDNSNIVSKLFSEWNFVNIYTSKGLDIPVDEVKSINRNTKLSAINEGKYQDGYITVVKDGVQTNIKLTSDDTVGTLMDELSLYGFESVINEKGQLLIKNTGNSLLQKYTGTEQASNALELLGIDLNNWIQTSSYKSDTLKVTQTSTIDSDVTRDTLLSELGVTTGEYNIFKNGVKYTAYISTGETMGSFLDTLKSFGIETSLVSDGDSSILTIIGSGDTYIAKSNSTTGASNVVEKLFANNDKYSSFRYKGLEQTSETVTHFTAATKDTLLSEFNQKDGSNTLKAEGDLSVTVNGETATIKIEADETFGSLIEKFKALGLEATISSTGQLMIQSGYNTFTINSDGTNSNLLSNVGLVYHNDLGGYVASTDTLKATTTTIEEKTFSVANYADYNTKMSLMNISSGTLSVYLNGQKATIKIDKNQTFGDLRSLVSTEFADVDLTFEDGYIKFYSKKDSDKVEVGATTDTSNFAAITGITSDGNGAVKSARELFCVNNSSVITNTGLFRKGDVTKGTFTVGNATFTIDDKTTISDIISQINSNDEANATAYWDSIEGNFVIKSRTTGSALINIEAGTSNFTDIMGFTNSEWAADGSLNVTRMNTASQEVGNNAKFSINGTYYTSTSNNITSDVSRIKGLTINLKGLTDGSAITLTVERDKETLANAVSDIVDSYNELMDNVDKEITKDGKLKDQSTLKLIRNQLRSLMTSSDAGTTIFRNLDAIGIKVEAASGNNISTSGLTTLTFDKDKFFEAFKSDQNAVKDLLIGSANNTGIFTKVENLVESSLKSVSGYFESADKSYQKQINKLDNKIEKQKTALERYRAQLESKFSSMDILIANMQQQYSSFLRT